MSRDFILVFSGGMVALITTLVVLFVADYFYRREHARQSQPTRSTSSRPAVTTLVSAPVPVAPSVASPAQAASEKVSPSPTGDARASPTTTSPPVTSNAGVSARAAEDASQSSTPSAAALVPVADQPSQSVATFPPPPETITKSQA